MLALSIHLKYLPRLRKRFRSLNLLERSFEQVRWQTKVMGRFPGERRCLSMCLGARRVTGCGGSG